MALNSCASLGYTYGHSFCMYVGVDDYQNEFTYDKPWIAGAFFLGLLLGAGIIAALTKPFLDVWSKKKKQDEESLLETTSKENFVETHSVNSWADKSSPIQKQSKNKGKNLFFKGVRFWRKKKGTASTSSNMKEAAVVKEDDVDPSLARGMVDVMIQISSAASEIEMADQNMATVVAMERTAEEERETLMLYVLTKLLRKKMEKRDITENFFHNFMKKTEEGVKDLRKMIEREKEEDEEKLKNNSQKTKDIQVLETEMQQLQTHYNNKQRKLQRVYKDKIRLDLLRSSGMSEMEVEEVMFQLMNKMAVVEEKLGLEQLRQRMALEQRLAKRRQAVEYIVMEAKYHVQEIDARVEILRMLLLAHKIKDGGKVEQFVDEVVSEYVNDLDTIRKYYAKEYEDLSLEKCELMHNFRLHSFFKLSKKQEKEKTTVVQTADRATSIDDFIRLYHDLVTRHHMDQETQCLELDLKEVQELHKIKQDILKEENKALEKEAEKYMDKLVNITNLTTSDIDKILKLYKTELAKYHGTQQKEKQATLARLQERLQQRFATADDTEAQDQKEQKILKEEQTAVLLKILKTNINLTQEVKDRVLREHQQNMQAMSNQLFCIKLRQQISLEIKLNQQKAALIKLQEQHDEIKRSKHVIKRKEKEDLEAKLAADIAKEEELFEAARQAAVMELRKQVATETEEALKLQDEEISLLIGRLQVGQAKRQTNLEKQNATMKKLQGDLERTIASAESLPVSDVEQIIQQHSNHISHLKEQIEKRRERQKKMIHNQVASMKAQMEEEIETILEEEAQYEYTLQKERGAGFANLALMQSLLTQRHAKAMVDLDTEMLAELEKYKSDLNTELELELKKGLEIQKQTLLEQLASETCMKKRNLENSVTNASSDVRRANMQPNQSQGIEYDMRQNDPSRRKVYNENDDDF